MKILMLSWEFPPHIVGGLGRHVYNLSKALASKGIKVEVITFTDGSSKSEEVIDGLKVIRVNPYIFRSPDFISWIHGMNFLMIKKAIINFDLIHVHDWLTAPAGIVMKHISRKPLISTIHSTELGRRGGILKDDYERHIHEIEWLLCYESWRVICCSEYMKDEISKFFSCPLNKIVKIPNGFEPLPPPANLNRRDYARDDEKIVLYIGRMVYEKGPHILLEAIRILNRNDLKFLFVGDGPMKPHLIEMSKRMGIAEKVYFLGHVSDEVLHALYKMAYLAVFPSLYEPFGIVALEAMGSGVPVIVSAVGGLNEIIEDGYNGIKFPSGSPIGLANAIKRLLDDKELYYRIVNNAKERMKNFTWDGIAEKTINVYQQVLEEYETGQWKPRV
ncbi:MAG: glycosyltransferase family 4 protein [Candidatus Methanomethyliaceae archaeon]|nr:glycosyltransferase family 4 protein [Candidatus Methanomethyliaceae archaeon]MDW7970618.1 glycosyltransferase family 4 protein [Nitrososphaerota archaeon]